MTLAPADGRRTTLWSTKGWELRSNGTIKKKDPSLATYHPELPSCISGSPPFFFFFKAPHPNSLLHLLHSQQLTCKYANLWPKMCKVCVQRSCSRWCMDNCCGHREEGEMTGWGWRDGEMEGEEAERHFDCEGNRKCCRGLKSWRERRLMLIYFICNPRDKRRGLI